MEVEPEGGGQERMTCSDRSLLLAYLSGGLSDLDSFLEAILHIDECEDCRRVIQASRKGKGLPQYDIKTMGEGREADMSKGIEEMLQELRSEFEVQQQLKRAAEERLKRLQDEIDIASRVRQREAILQVVKEAGRPLSISEITVELERVGFRFQVEAPAHRKASVYQACRHLERAGLLAPQGAGQRKAG